MKKYNNGEFRLKDAGNYFEVYGWVNKRRDMGGVIFVDLRDRSGMLQIVLNRDFLKDDFKVAETLKNEYCIKAYGKLEKRGEGLANPNLSTGEVELIVENLEILSECDILPFNVYEDTNINENISLKYRYLDLRKERLQNTIMTRHKITSSIREYLNGEGFLDIETPILCKSTPEGARDYIVPSRINKGSFYALPQSPQICKQLLMVSGFEKYYQIAKCFRDEDLRADRQPEFTQIDMEMSFVTEEDVMNNTENLLKKVVKDVKGIDVPDFPRLPYKEAMERYGSDKPDTRFEMELLDLTEILRGTQMNVFNNVISNGGIVKCLIVKNNGDKYSRSDVEHLTDFVKIYGAKGLAWLKYDNDTFNGVIAKNLEEEKLELMRTTYNITNNDLVLIVADTPKIVYAALGALRLKLAKELNLIDENKLNFLWVTEFPMYEYSESEKRYKSCHHPFTMPISVDKLSDYENCTAKAYDIVLNGYEVGGGSIRIHDPKVQAIVFKELGISDEEAQKKFGFFIDAFKFGAPPHGGLALGLDRLVMILCGTENIKDVIAFPKTQSASDLMMEAPSEVTLEQLKELEIKIDVEEDNE
ncbi:MAG: aspartate--tRNA ligase [Bacilli bacterium]|nr:aspartate--tRNA ligase [Bacilli bacterium]